MFDISTILCSRYPWVKAGVKIRCAGAYRYFYIVVEIILQHFIEEFQAHSCLVQLRLEERDLTIQMVAVAR
jgi:hypothetical protein